MGLGFWRRFLMGTAFQPAHEEQRQSQNGYPEKRFFAFHGAKVHFLFLNKVSDFQKIAKLGGLCTKKE